jgi:hypothetical protein
MLGAGCEPAAKVHPFYAAPYDPDTGCLGASAFVDVLDGPDPGECEEPMCWLDTKGRAWVSVLMCDGPPDWTRVQAPVAGSLCAAALEALSRQGLGQCAPEAGAEAGGADAGADDSPDDG